MRCAEGLGVSPNAPRISAGRECSEQAEIPVPPNQKSVRSHFFDTLSPLSCTAGVCAPPRRNAGAGVLGYNGRNNHMGFTSGAMRHLEVFP